VNARRRLTSVQLSDLLSYEDAVALKGLAQESQVESKSMCDLTVREHNEEL
jgi:hypothetical protein